jgi:hypothetical protein
LGTFREGASLNGSLHDFLWEVIGTNVSCYADRVTTSGHDLGHDGVLLFNINANKGNFVLVLTGRFEDVSLLANDDLGTLFSKKDGGCPAYALGKQLE